MHPAFYIYWFAGRTACWSFTEMATIVCNLRRLGYGCRVTRPYRDPIGRYFAAY